MYQKVGSIRDLPDILLRQISHFFERYKDLEDGKSVRIDRWGDDAEARELIVKSVLRAKAEMGTPIADGLCGPREKLVP